MLESLLLTLAVNIDSIKKKKQGAEDTESVSRVLSLGFGFNRCLFGLVESVV